MWINYKPDDGKMLRIYIDLDENSIIKDIKITGDFFYFPINGLELLEEFLKGKKINEKLGDEINEFFTRNNHKVLGFNGEDIENAIKLGFK